MSSNDLTQVRDYIKSRVLAVDSNYQEWTDSLEDIGNIPQNLLDRTFHITLEPLSTSFSGDLVIDDSFPVKITIFQRAYNSPVSARDELIQKGNCIRLDSINPLNVEAYKSLNDGNIESVESVGITPTEINSTNDNTIKVEVELNVRLFFDIT
jgi:hypothetical protein